MTIVDDFAKESVDLMAEHGISGQYCRACAGASCTVSRFAFGNSHRSGTGVQAGDEAKKWKFGDEMLSTIGCRTICA
jgi:hypothetical protein